MPRSFLIKKKEFKKSNITYFGKYVSPSAFNYVRSTVFSSYKFFCVELFTYKLSQSKSAVKFTALQGRRKIYPPNDKMLNRDKIIF